MPKKRIAQAAVLVIMLGVTAVSGKSIYEGNYGRVHNYQQVPDEVAGICELIQADAQGEKFTFASDDDISSYVRVYDPSIYNLIGRNARSTQGRSRKLYYEINSPEPDYRIIAIGGKYRCVIIWH